LTRLVASKSPVASAGLIARVQSRSALIQCIEFASAVTSAVGEGFMSTVLPLGALSVVASE
jgi:hypothetical protein